MNDHITIKTHVERTAQIPIDGSVVIYGITHRARAVEEALR